MQGTRTGALQFIEAMLRAGASNWGNVTDVLILQEQGKPVAAAAGYTPNSEDYCPLRLSSLGRIAQDLNWSKEIATAFRDRDRAILGWRLPTDFPDTPSALDY